MLTFSLSASPFADHAFCILSKKSLLNVRSQRFFCLILSPGSLTILHFGGDKTRDKTTEKMIPLRHVKYNYMCLHTFTYLQT